MKKTICVAALLLVVVCLISCLAGCVDKETLVQLNKLSRKQYSQMDITVVSAKGEDKLTSRFLVTVGKEETTIRYAVEHFSTFVENSTSTPDKYIQEYAGTIVVKDGAVVSNSGALVDEKLDLESILPARFNFVAKYFKQVQISDGSFSAKVVKPQAFLGNSSFQCEGGYINVDVNYSTVLEEMVLTYTDQQGWDVTITYLFTI